MVDADTIVHPNCPNFFNETDGKYCGVMNDGDYEWVLRSIRGFGNELFDGIGERGILIIPEHLDLEIRNNLDFYTQQISTLLGLGGTSDEAITYVPYTEG